MRYILVNYFKYALETFSHSELYAGLPMLLHGTGLSQIVYRSRPMYQGPKNYIPYSFSTFRTSKRGQPLYKGQNS